MPLNVHMAMIPGQTNREAEHVPGEDIKGLIRRLGVDPKLVEIAIVNGKLAALSTRLNEGDKIKLFPVAAGG